jgi:beta-lactamase regulating signal transducer with metallopeptidase domain
MEQIFIDVVNMSLTASVVILAVLVIRLFFSRAPKIFSYVLWAIVLIRLLCPLSFRTDFSLLGLFGNASNGQGKMEYISNSFMYQTNTGGQFFSSGIENGAGNILTAGEVMDSLNPMQLLLTVGAWVWVIGLIIMLATSAVSVLRLHKKLKLAVPEVSTGMCWKTGTGTRKNFHFWHLEWATHIMSTKRWHLFIMNRIHSTLSQTMWREHFPA